MEGLVPKDPESHSDLFRRDQSDQDGSFSLRSVIPGTYTVVAIEDGWDLDWSRPGVIAHYVKHGQTVTVTDRSQNPRTCLTPLKISRDRKMANLSLRGCYPPSS